jgi:PhzF family phenazine biosynthesis protein
MMNIHNIKIYHLDAFTASHFMGNPASICVSEAPLERKLMQNISGEINLSETAFIAPAVGSGHYSIRWFTPLCEADLCGHATLAAARVLYDFYEKEREDLRFSSRSGELSTCRKGSAIMLDFPIDGPR